MPFAASFRFVCETLINIWNRTDFSSQESPHKSGKTLMHAAKKRKPRVAGLFTHCEGSGVLLLRAQPRLGPLQQPLDVGAMPPCEQQRHGEQRRRDGRLRIPPEPVAEQVVHRREDRGHERGRSEERRVGKECYSRRGPYHTKKQLRQAWAMW